METKQKIDWKPSVLRIAKWRHGEVMYEGIIKHKRLGWRSAGPPKMFRSHAFDDAFSLAAQLNRCADGK